MRLVTITVALLMLLAPVAMSDAVREDVYEPVLDEFTPAETDKAAVEKQALINCGASSDTGDTPHPNDQMECWDDDGNAQYWSDAPPSHYADDTDASETMVAASPPFYECTTEGVSIGIQNPFPIHRPDGVVNDHEADPGDKKASQQGVLTATSSFFVVPEFNGPRADEIDGVWFGFFQTSPSADAGVAEIGPSEVCASDGERVAKAAPEGAYYEFYRGDDDPEDGWSIPVNTLLVPDGLYGAHLRAVSEVDESPVGVSDVTGPPGGAEVIASGFVYALVDNHDNWFDSLESCTPTVVDCDNQDITPPWAMVVPGDSSFDAFKEANGIPESQDFVTGWTIEFGSPVVTGLSSFWIIRGDNAPDPGEKEQLFADEQGNSAADVDPIPLYNVAEDPEWGPKLYFNDTKLYEGDTVHLDMTDEHGNQAYKTVTIGNEAE